MEPAKEPLDELEHIDTINPAPEHKEIVESMQRTWSYLIAGYERAVAGGLLSSENKAQGMLAACSKLLAHHIMQFGVNKLLPLEELYQILGSCNVNMIEDFKAAYQLYLDQTLMSEAREITKQ